MAKQDVKGNEQQGQSSQTQPMTRGSQQPQGNLMRRTTYPVGMMSPGDFFRMGPFSLMRRMSEEMDRVFGEFGLRGSSNSGISGKAIWAPAVEVSERDGKYVVHADLPGISPGDVKLEISDDAVVLQGERKIEREEDQQGVHVTERQYGHFYRSIPLPEGAKVENARAKFDNGVLEISVPLDEQKNKPREIPIESTPSASGTPSGKAA